MPEEVITYQSDRYSIETSGSKFYVIAQVMSTDLIPEDILRNSYQSLKGKEARIEHISPDEAPFSHVGETVEVWWDDVVNQPFAKIEVFGDSRVEKELREDLIRDQSLPVEQRKYKGVSAGVIKIIEKNSKKLKKVRFREISFTRDPVCEPCEIAGIQTYSRSNKMTDEAISLLKENFSKTESLYKEQVEQKEKEIARLTENFSKKEKEIEAITELYEKNMADKIDEIKTLKAEIVEYKKGSEDLKKENEKLNKTPIIEKILGNYSKDTDIYKEKFNQYLELPIESLNLFWESIETTVNRYSQPLVQSGGAINPQSLIAGTFSNQGNPKYVQKKDGALSLSDQQVRGL